QLEKQRKLNELEIIVILRLDQIHHYTNFSVPSDMTSSLIFLRHTLHALRKRIKELEEEKKHQRVERKQAKARHAMLQKHKKLFQVSYSYACAFRLNNLSVTLFDYEVIWLVSLLTWTRFVAQMDDF
ncbi:unnamed protein product, partial [Trichobilharzia regenti]